MPSYKNFNYMDGLGDTVIDLTEYLSLFSNENYTLDFSNLQPVTATISNLFNYTTLVEDYRERGASYSLYEVEEGEMASDVAVKFYGSEDYWWIVTLFNNIKNVFTEWPIKNEQILYLVDILYEKENLYSKEGYFNLLFQRNEGLRKIEILTKDKIAELIYQFRTKIVTTSSTVLSNTVSSTVRI